VLAAGIAKASQKNSQNACTGSRSSSTDSATVRTSAGSGSRFTGLTTGLNTASSGTALSKTASSETASANKNKHTNSVYIVRMADDPVVAYKGGIKGYSATAPKKGQKIDPDSPQVAKYLGYLTAKHDMALGKVGGELYIACAEFDDLAPLPMVEELRGLFKEAGSPGELELYPGVHHGFAFPQRKIYDRPAAERHWERLIALYRRRLG